MLIRARNEHGIDLKRSVVVGDKDDDMVLAKVAGAKGVLVRTGKAQSSLYADAVVDGSMMRSGSSCPWMEKVAMHKKTPFRKILIVKPVPSAMWCTACRS